MAGSMLTEEELALLTEDERRALEELGPEYDAENEEEPVDPWDDDEGEEEGEEESDGGDAGADDDDGEEDPAEGDDAGEDDAKAGDDKPEDEPAQEEPEEEPAPAPAAKPQQPAPLLNADLPEGYEDKLREFDEKLTQLDSEFDDGELTTQEYRQAVKETQASKQELEQQVFKANLAREMEENRAKQEWIDTVNGFLDDHPDYRQSERMYRLLDIEVKTLAQTEEAQRMTGAEILAKAHENIAADIPMGKKEAIEEPKQEPAKKAKKAERRNVPPTLANVPASDMTAADEGGRFAKLDKLDGLDLEAELARLSVTNPRLVEEYLSQ